MANSQIAIQHAVGELVEPLHDSLESARVALDERFAGVARDDDQRWLRAHVLRGLTYRALERCDLGSWKLGGGHARNGQVHLTSVDGTLRIRLLHDGDERCAPPAGHNALRRAYYVNQPLPYTDLDLFGVVNHGLLVLWQEFDRGEEFALRLVRPLEPGRYGKNLKADIDIDLPRSKSDFLSLKFAIADEDLTYGVADEEKGDGGAS